MHAMLVVLALASCSEEPSVPLVQLSGIAPRRLELGDKLEIEGAAFPQGRKARVLFEGTLHRPNEAADPDGDIDLQGDVVAPDRIEIAVTDTVLAAFCGAGSSAVHTTFDGSVTVVFAAQRVGAPPVSGNLQHASLDVLPTAAGQARYLADAEDGDKLLRSAGMRVESRASGGLVVTNVEPGSRAATGGIMPDDVIASSNGVHAISVADLAPTPGAASLAMVVQRAGTEELHAIPLDGAHPETPTRFAAPAALVGGIAILLALLAASPGRSVTWFRRRLATTRGPSSVSESLGRALGLATASALPLLVPSADVGLLALVLFTGALATALLMARGVIGAASRIVPVAAALAGALVLAGSLRADELAAAQGAAPWGFFALRSPAHAALALVCCTWGSRRGDNEAEHFVATLHSALVVVVFFGGWRCPFLSTHAHGAGLWLATACFLLKTAFLERVIRRVRDALPPRPLRASMRTAWLYLVPLAAVATLGASAWERHVTSRGVAAATTFALAALGAAAFVQLALFKPGPRTRIDPLA